MSTGDHATEYRACQDALRNMLGAAPSPLAITRGDGTFVMVNRAFCELVDRRDSEMVQSSLASLLEAEDLASFSRLARQLANRDVSACQTNQRLRRPDGSVVCVRADLWPLWTPCEEVQIVHQLHVVAPEEQLGGHAAALIASSGEAITGYSLDGRIIHWNPAAENLYGISARDAVGQRAHDVLPAEWAADIGRLLERVAGGERISNYETSRPRRDGTRVDMSLSIGPIVDGSQRISGASVVARDITRRRRAESVLEAQSRVLEMIAAGAMLELTLDALARIVDVHASPIRCSILLLDGTDKVLRHGGGLEVSGVEDASVAEVVPHAPGGPWGQAAAIVADLTTDARWARARDAVLSLGLRTCWSSPIVAPGTDQLLGVFVLYSEEAHGPSDDDWKLLARLGHVAALAIGQHRTVTALAYQAIHDPLTGAANRTLVADRLAHALQRRRTKGATTAVFFLDLDRFKALNDRHGHDAGDRVLIELTRRLRTAVRPGDTVARLGGDEFVVLCDPVVGELEAVGIADRIEHAVAGAFWLGGAEVHLTASIGIAFPRAGDTAERVLSQADAAMYQAKERGKARFQVFDTTMHESALARLQVEHGLREALERQQQFKLVYQPLVDLDSEHVVGVEALLRWDHPERGMLAPGEFLSVAEESGLIVPIGTWVIHEACRQAARLQREGARSHPLKMHVNVSPRQLSAKLPDLVRTAALTSGVDPAALCLEITETVVMADTQLAVTVLEALKALGVQLSVDDFGTGYSSLSYVNALPIDQLKIDRSFIRHLDADAESPIVLAVVGLSHALDLEVVAEGVETAEQVRQLRQMGCDIGQGYYWSQPMDLDSLVLT
jgi:diguanylate cyclase (GGDEF)-like protein/PAS domain S-box-containing protein